MSSSRRTRRKDGTGGHRAGSGPLAFFVSLIIVALGAIQLVSAFHTYALDVAQLNGLKRQEASLIAQKRSLEEEIARWDDKAYVTAQARERLGFVFPGEVSVHVEHPEAVEGSSSSSSSSSSGQTSTTVLPWYTELANGIEKADDAAALKSSSSSASSSSGSSSSSSSTQR
ncbi:septum formation initiator family protein [uncultured Bifidobacterium sp.]|uniref:FtsB family cell division protein n=1 Tax=uncultured Bifidobacterium sp. TaxID=165187 RepID=UPI0028DB5FB1|nr:septum formation initiator family protein [uncultured Bifidobacterium sp.]